MSGRSIVIFDFGGVLIDWDPRNLYRKLFEDDEAAMERFLGEVCTPSWNQRQDAGRLFIEAEAELVDRFPEHEGLIRAWRRRFHEMIPGALEDVVQILTELKQRGTPLYGLSNWSAETFMSMPARFPFFEWFEDIVLSGREGVIKPDPRIYEILLSRNALPAERAVFIDDSKPNIAAANAFGIHGIHFTSAAALRADLSALGLL